MLDEIALGPTTSVQVSPFVTEAATLVVTADSSAAAAAAAAAAAHLSPSLELNPAIGIVVIQFRNQSGRIELSIPSQQQLDAYAADPLQAFHSETSTTV